MTPIQNLTLVFAVLSFTLMAYWKLKDNRVTLYLVPPSLWMAHVIIFYIARDLDLNGIINLHKYNFTLFTDWSAYLRFHGVFTVFYSLFILSDVYHDIEKGARKLWKIIHH